MKIAIADLSNTQNQSKHAVRGSGFYIDNLKAALLKYFPQNYYVFFRQASEIPQNMDIIHYPYFEPFFLSLPIIKRGKTVVTIHDLTPLVFPKEFPAGIKGKATWIIQKTNLKTVTAIITDSYTSKEDIQKIVGIEQRKIHVVYLAASEIFRKIRLSDQDKITMRKKFDLPKNFLLYVGDATPNKNLPRMLAAVKKAKIPLVMVGKVFAEQNIDVNNEWNKDLVYVQKLLQDEKELIKVVGFVSSDDLVTLYNLATALLMPSLYEGFGLPVLEAMQCGCPVITSNDGSLKEISGKAVYSVDPYNIEDIERGIRDVFSKKELQKKLSQKGVEQASRFSWKNTAEKVNEVYKRVL